MSHLPPKDDLYSRIRNTRTKTQALVDENKKMLQALDGLNDTLDGIEELLKKDEQLQKSDTHSVRKNSP